MFGVIMRRGEDERRFIPKKNVLGYTFVDSDGSQYDTVKIDGYYFPVDDDRTISDGYNLMTGERVYIYDMHTNQRAEVFYEFCNLTYRYTLEHRMPKGVTVQRFEVAEPIAL